MYGERLVEAGTSKKKWDEGLIGDSKMEDMQAYLKLIYHDVNKVGDIGYIVSDEYEHTRILLDNNGDKIIEKTVTDIDTGETAGNIGLRQVKDFDIVGNVIVKYLAKCRYNVDEGTKTTLYKLTDNDVRLSRIRTIPSNCLEAFSMLTWNGNFIAYRGDYTFPFRGCGYQSNGFEHGFILFDADYRPIGSHFREATKVMRTLTADKMKQRDIKNLLRNNIGCAIVYNGTSGIQSIQNDFEQDILKVKWSDGENKYLFADVKE